MRLTVGGCSPAWPNPGGAHSGYLVEGEAGSILLDCGPGVLARLRSEGARAAGDWPKPDAIVITHFHLDHWGDLVPWVWGSLHLGNRGVFLPKPELWVPAGGRAQLEHFGSLLGFPDMFERVFTPLEYEAGVASPIAGYSVLAAKVPHYRMDAHALRVTDGENVLAYSGDSGPSDELVRLAEGADLFVCEATLLEGDLDGAPRGHLSLEEALATYERSGARRLLVTHRPSEHPTPDELELAHDGLVVTV